MIPAGPLRTSGQPQMALSTNSHLATDREFSNSYLFLFSGILRGVVLACEENRVPRSFAELWHKHRRLDRKQGSQQNTKGWNFANCIFLRPHDTVRNYTEAQHSQKLV